jgi:Amidase
MNMPIKRRAFVGSALAAACAAGLLKPRFSLAKDAFSNVDAVGQAALVRSKQITSLELVDAAVARIQSGNPKINAVVAEYFDKARKRATGALPAGPLSGVPYLIKDLNDIKGEVATSGSRLMAQHIGSADSLMARKAIDSGMLIVANPTPRNSGCWHRPKACFWVHATIRGISIIRPADRPAGLPQPSRQGWYRSRTPATAAAPSVFQHPAAVSSA